MQANSKAHVFLLPIILALKQMSFQLFLEGREKNEGWMESYVQYDTQVVHQSIIFYFFI